MSRSRRRHPYIPMTCAESEKDDKRRYHRSWRRAVRVALRLRRETLPHKYQHSDPYKWDKDGHQRVDPQRQGAWKLLGK